MMYMKRFFRLLGLFLASTMLCTACSPGATPDSDPAGDPDVYKRQYFEVASIEGANTWDAFWKITFPVLLPTCLLVTVYAMVDSFTEDVYKRQV